MLTVSICYGPDVIAFEVLLVVLTLWFLSMLQLELPLDFIFNADIYTDILNNKGPLPFLRLGSTDRSPRACPGLPGAV